MKKKIKWNKIKELYPKSWDVLNYWFDDFIGYDSILDVNDNSNLIILESNLDKSIFPIYYLYDFFDSHELFISIMYVNNLNRDNDKFKWEVSDLEMRIDRKIGNIVYGRTNAEKTAFEKAFEILEQQLQSTY